VLENVFTPSNNYHMKKLSLTLMMLCAVTTFTFAQSFSFGPKVGVNVSNYTGGNIESDALVGFIWAVFCNLE
jgi:hypothetical protein